MVPPFVELGNRLMLVVNWTADLDSDHNLLLRPLSAREEKWLRKELQNAYADVYSRLLISDEERLGEADFSDPNNDAT